MSTEIENQVCQKVARWAYENSLHIPFDFDEECGFGRKDAFRGAKVLSDISAHMPMLTFLASNCEHVTEFGMRDGYSTGAFLTGGCLVTSYDINTYKTNQLLEDHPRWSFVQADTSKLQGINVTDLLFIDSLHTYAQVKAELKMAHYVKKWLVFHDTVSQGDHSLDVPGEEGITRAITEFVRDYPEWVPVYDAPFNHGLLVLQRGGR